MSGGWKNERPPNETWVEVMDGKNVIEAMAFFGRDGHKPHWQLRDGSCCDPSRFSRWREVGAALTMICKCPCHVTPGMMHFINCCNVCMHCNQRIVRSVFSEHVALCKLQVPTATDTQ